MRPNHVPLSVIAAALSACVAEPESLNSERIGSRFGSYGIDVVANEHGIRRSNLYSIHDGDRTCRTYAVVRFSDAPDLAIGTEHAKIIAGDSIGETFRAHGWEIYKETRYAGALSLPGEGHPIADLMRLESAVPLAMHVYRLLLQKNGRVIDYATIIEIHHPDYLDVDGLQDVLAIDDAPTADAEQLASWRALVFADR